MTATTVGLLHPGQMGAAVGASAVLAGHRVLWCRDGRSASTSARAEAAGLTAVDELGDLLASSDVVLSICPPAAAEDVAAAVAAGGYRGVFVEANAIGPERAARIAGGLVRVGAVAVDGCVIGPPPTGGRSARLYLSGDPDATARVAGLFAGGPVRAEVLDREIGAASALKMAFAGYQKSTRVLAAVAHALADVHGVTAELRSEARSMASAPLDEPDYLPGVAARAWRWGPEMGEVADTLGRAGIPSDLAEATAAVLSRWAADRDRWDLSLADTLARLTGQGLSGPGPTHPDGPAPGPPRGPDPDPPTRRR